MAADPSVSHKAWCERLLLEQAGTVGMKEALRQILLRITGGAEADAFFKELCTYGKHPQVRPHVEAAAPPVRAALCHAAGD